MPRGRRPGTPQPAEDEATLLAKGATPPLAKLATRVGELRVEKGWTRQQLTTAASLNNRQLTEIETGGRDPTFTTLLKLCHAFDLDSIDTLIGRPLPPM
jgi:DNA-binding XRE family transcriptional regulator